MSEPRARQVRHGARVVRARLHRRALPSPGQACGHVSCLARKFGCPFEEGPLGKGRHAVFERPRSGTRRVENFAGRSSHFAAREEPAPWRARGASGPSLNSSQGMIHHVFQQSRSIVFCGRTISRATKIADKVAAMCLSIFGRMVFVSENRTNVGSRRCLPRFSLRAHIDLQRVRLDNGVACERTGKHVRNSTVPP